MRLSDLNPKDVEVVSTPAAGLKLSQLNPADIELVPQETKPDVSELESALRGAAQGSTLGYADEATGALEALKDELTGNAGDKSLGDLYRQHRDESRKAYEAAAKANPKSYMAGQIGGGLATALIPGANLAKGATLGARALGAGALGAAYGLGDSDADLTKGEVGQALKDAAIGGTVGAVAQPVAEKFIQPALEAGVKKLNPLANYILAKGNRAILGVPEQATETYLKNPQAVRSAGDLEDIADSLAGKAKQLDQDSLEHYRTRVLPSLDDSESVLKSQDIGDEIDRLQSKLGVQTPNGPVYVGSDAQRAAKMLGALKAQVQGLGEDLTENQIGQIVKRLDDNVNWSSDPDQSQSGMNALRQLRGSLSAYLKQNNPEYAKAMAEQELYQKARAALNGQFGISKSLLGGENVYNPTDKTLSSLKAITNPNKVNSENAADLLQQVTSPSFGQGTSPIEGNPGGLNLKQDVQNWQAKKAFQNDTTNGSRRVMLGTAMGAGAGMLTGNPVLASSVGAGVGAFVDKYGGQAARTLLDGKLFTERQLGRIANSQFGDLIGRAAMKGNQSVAATMYILSGNSPEFRNLMKDDDNGQQ